LSTRKEKERCSGYKINYKSSTEKIECNLQKKCIVDSSQREVKLSGDGLKGLKITESRHRNE